MENKKVSWEDIEKVNSDMELFTMERNEYNKKEDKWDVKKTKYAEVKERVIAFRKLYPNGKIATSYTTTENYIVFEAIISDENCNILATGYARELAKNEYSLEKAETSAIGRALGFCGLGIKTGIASKEDIEDYEDKKIFDAKQIENDKQRRLEANDKFNKLPNTTKVQILNLMHVKKVEDIPLDMLEEFIRTVK